MTTLPNKMMPPPSSDRLAQDLAIWFAQRGGAWSGTLAELLTAVRAGSGVGNGLWPESGRELYNHLNAQKATLRSLGVDVLLRDGIPRIVSLRSCSGEPVPSISPSLAPGIDPVPGPPSDFPMLRAEHATPLVGQREAGSSDIVAAHGNPVADEAIRGHLRPAQDLLADHAERIFCVGAAHAGWRGLAAGVLEATIKALGVAPAELVAWLGPSIGPEHFEVGDEVREAFVRSDPDAEVAFTRNARGRWQCDLPGIASARLRRAGIGSVAAEGACVYADAQRFYSYRRDGQCGRMAALIWLAPAEPLKGHRSP